MEFLPGSQCLFIVFSERRILKRVYLWNWIGYDAGSALILKLINCTFTCNNKPEIDGQREVPPFLRSYHILLEASFVKSQKGHITRIEMVQTVLQIRFTPCLQSSSEPIFREVLINTFPMKLKVGTGASASVLIQLIRRSETVPTSSLLWKSSQFWVRSQSSSAQILSVNSTSC